MRHIFLLKPVDDDYDHHPFIETIREVMQAYDYDIFMSTYPDHAKKIIKHYKEMYITICCNVIFNCVKCFFQLIS